MQEVLPPKIAYFDEGQAIDPLTPHNFTLNAIEYPLLIKMKILHKQSIGYYTELI